MVSALAGRGGDGRGERMDRGVPSCSNSCKLRCSRAATRVQTTVEYGSHRAPSANGASSSVYYLRPVEPFKSPAFFTTCSKSSRLT
eukprot:4958726-Prymnesium_polylepis.1